MEKVEDCPCPSALYIEVQLVALQSVVVVVEECDVLREDFVLALAPADGAEGVVEPALGNALSDHTLNILHKDLIALQFPSLFLLKNPSTHAVNSGYEVRVGQGSILGLQAQYAIEIQLLVLLAYHLKGHERNQMAGEHSVILYDTPRQSSARVGAHSGFHAVGFLLRAP